MIARSQAIVSTPAPGQSFSWVKAKASTPPVARQSRFPSAAGKYGQAFAALDFEEAYVCKPNHVNRVAVAMRAYVSKYEPNAVVVTQSQSDDGTGRVFKRELK